ncbi:MAG: nitrogenase molybdenum-iron protein subunit beta [Nitrospinae bacterium]|nr:nitrogenase molybdenum-iron protein subunit beta [Nitrospinota bacterium]
METCKPAMEGGGSMSCTEIMEWVNTKEYRELNFKREALVINPPKACQPLGAIFCAAGFEGTLPFVHGSQGCVAYFRNNLSRHFREPFSAVSTSMTEDAAVFGGMNNLIEGLQNSYSIYKPKVIAVSTSCMAEVIGDDLNSFILKARELGVIPKDFPVPFAHTPSFVGSHINGYDNMLKAILSNLTEGKKGSKNNRINIIPGFDPYVANIMEIKRILDIMEVEYTILVDNSDVFDSPQSPHPPFTTSPSPPSEGGDKGEVKGGKQGGFEMYPGGTKLKDAGDSINSKATIALQKFSTMQTIKFIQEIYEHEGLQIYPPMGIRATDKFLMEIKRLTGIPIPEAMETERGRAVDAATDAHQYIHGKRFAVFGDPDEVYGIVNFLLEMGGEPVHILTATGTKQFRDEMKVLLDSSPYGRQANLYIGKDLWHLRSLLMTEPVDMLIGDSHGKWAARDAGIPLLRIGYPIFDRVNLHRYPTIGYTGTINLISWIANSFIDEVDRKSDDAHFELLR